MIKRVVLAGCLVLALGLLFWFGSSEESVNEVSMPVQVNVGKTPSSAETTPPTLNNTDASTVLIQSQSTVTVAGNQPQNEREQALTTAPPIDTETASRQNSEPELRSRPVDNAPKLSEHVFTVIEDVQTMQLEGRWEESLTQLNALYEDYDSLSNFEQTTLLNFYTNTLLRFEMWPEAIGAFSRMLVIPDLRPDIGARALMALGQLHNVVGEYGASVSYLETWQRVTSDMENMERSRERVAVLLEESRAALQ